MTELPFFAERPPPPDTRYTPALLDGARRRGDPLADAAVAAMAASGRPLTHPARLVRALAEAGEPACAAFVDRVDARPDWVDFEAMLPCAELALRNVVPAAMGLLVASLPESYVSATGAKVLTRTGRLARDTFTRLMETVQFVSDLGLCRGARPGTRAGEHALAVRLMHAWARRGCRRSGWDEDADGPPVHQEDMLMTLCCFGLVWRRSMERMGVQLSAQEHASTCHSWRFTGWLMGIEEGLLPEGPEEEEALYLALTARLRPTEDSRALTRALIEHTAGRSPVFLPAPMLRALMTHLVGQPLADALGVEPAPVARAALALAVRAQRLDDLVQDHLPTLTRGRVGWGEAIVSAIQRTGLPEPTEYPLPPQSPSG